MFWCKFLPPTLSFLHILSPVVWIILHARLRSSRPLQDLGQIPETRHVSSQVQRPLVWLFGCLSLFSDSSCWNNTYLYGTFLEVLCWQVWGFFCGQCVHVCPVKWVRARTFFKWRFFFVLLCFSNVSRC